MFKLTDAYNSDSASPFATAVLTIGTAVFFSIGLFMILNAHDRSQAKQMQQTVAALRKSQEEGISVNAALEELRSETDKVKKKKTPVVTTFETLSVKGESTLQGNVNTNKDLSVGGKLGVKGDSTLSGDLSAKGNVNIGGDLGVDGTIGLQTALAVGGDTTAYGGFKVQGTTTLAGGLEVQGEASFANLSVESDTVLYAGLTVAGGANMGGGLEVTGSTAVGSLSIGGDTLLDSGLSIQGGLTTTGDFGVTGATTVGGNVQVNGGALFDNTTAQTPIALAVQGAALLNAGVEVVGATTVGSTITVQGASLLDGSTLAAGSAALAVQGAATFDGSDLSSETTHTVVVNGSTTTTTDTSANPLTLEVSGAVTAASLDVIGATYIDNNLTVSGATTIDGTDLAMETVVDTANSTTTTRNGTTLTVTGVATINNTFGVQGAAAIDTLTVAGATSLLSTLSVGSEANFGTTLIVGGGTTVDSLVMTSTVSDSQGNTTQVPTSVSLQNGLVVTNEADFGTNLTVAGVTSVGSATVASGTFADTLTVGGGMNIDGNLTVQSTVVNGSTVGGALNVGIFTLDGLTDTFLVNGHGGRTVDATDGSASCDNTTQHIRISRIEAGVVTGASCVNNTGGSPNYDLAENYPSTQNLSAGDVVAIDPVNSEFVVKSTVASDNMIIGVVSTAPGLTLGQDGPGYPIALAGRVPVKVTDEGGAIAAGDYLTSAGTAGYAKKAAPGDKTIGQALEPFAGTSGTVKMFVHVSRPAQQNIVQLVQTPLQDANFTSLNVSGQTTLTNLQVTGLATIQDLHVTGTATVATLMVNGHIIGNDDTRGSVTVPAGTKTVHHDFASAYSKVPAVVASPTNQAVLFTVTPTATGFDINLPTNAAADTSFNYLVQE